MLFWWIQTGSSNADAGNHCASAHLQTLLLHCSSTSHLYALFAPLIASAPLPCGTMSSPPHESPPQPPTVRPSRSRRRAKESARTPFDDDSTWKLFITTHSQIKAWDQSSCDTVFSSSSRGIVAAKRARDGELTVVQRSRISGADVVGSAVAIADAQVVMLHNYKETQDKTYRLKATQVSIYPENTEAR